MSKYNKYVDEIRLSDDAKERIKKLYSEETDKEEKKFKRNNKKLRFVLKPIIAVAVCIIAIVSVFAVRNVNMSKNSASLFVMASELKNGEIVVLEENPGGGYAAGDNEVILNLDTEIMVEGDNIKTVEYSINDGRLTAVIEKGEAYKLQGQSIDPIVTSAYDTKIYEVIGYTSVVADYAKGTPKMIGFNVGDVLSFDECEGLMETSDLEDKSEILNSLLKKMVMTVTVTYDDGEVQSEYIRFGTIISTLKEQGYEAIDETMDNQKRIFFVAMCE